MLNLLEELCDEKQLGLFRQYLELLLRWNKVYNLTAIRDPEKMVTHHFLDSLAVLPDLQGETILDVGTGAGIPGIPLAIMCPDKQFTLLDSNGKKTRFIIQAIAELGLKNVLVEQARVEQYQNDIGFDVIISRAFSDIAQFVTLTQHLIKEKGQWLAMKGQDPAQELQALAKIAQVIEVKKLRIAQLPEARHLVRMRPH